MREKKYYFLEMRYKKNEFLMVEMEHYRSQKRALRKCEELNAELEELGENSRFVLIDEPFVGKGCYSFGTTEIYYTVSDLRKQMSPQKRRYKSWNNMKELFDLLDGIFDGDESLILRPTLQAKENVVD